MNEFKEYQKQAMVTAKESARNLPYMALGVAGEAGEIANKAKKVIRDQCGVITPEFKATMIGEIGDVMWYCAGLCEVLGIELSSVAEANIAKLKDRQARGTIGGSGDNR